MSRLCVFRRVFLEQASFSGRSASRAFQNASLFKSAWRYTWSFAAINVEPGPSICPLITSIRRNMINIRDGKSRFPQQSLCSGQRSRVYHQPIGAGTSSQNRRRFSQFSWNSISTKDLRCALRMGQRRKNDQTRHGINTSLRKHPMQQPIVPFIISKSGKRHVPPCPLRLR